MTSREFTFEKSLVRPLNISYSRQLVDLVRSCELLCVISVLILLLF